jgi:hypothetical protein
MRVANSYRNSLICLALCLAGCDLINPSEPIPAFIRVDEILVDPVGGTGTTAQQFEEVWVYLDGNLRGAYSLPAVIPLLVNGPAEILMFPGIRVNGVRSHANFYPFFEPLEQNFDLVPGETQTVQVRTRYRSTTTIAYLEDFETGNSLTDEIDGDVNTIAQRVTTGAYEGSGCGLINLNADADYIQVATQPLMTNLPVNGTPVYIELHYKNNVEFAIGLIGHIQGLPPTQATILILRPQEDWYKVYVDLSPALNASQLQAYQLVFSAVHDSTLTQSQVFMDNLKVVHIDQ